MNHTHLRDSAGKALIVSVLVVALGIFAFFTFEPSIGLSQETFTVSQTITDEISFLVAPADVSMTGTIAGLTGGYATGTTVAVLSSNDAQGLTMTLVFSSTTAMKLNGASSTINNYSPTATTAPDFLWVDNSAGQPAEFGYTVRASTTGEVDLSFRNDGAACNVGSNEDNDRCWQNPSTTPETIISTTAATPSSTTTIKFKVAVPNTPSPTLPTGVYVATGTLTATNNP